MTECVGTRCDTVDNYARRKGANTSFRGQAWVT